MTGDGLGTGTLFLILLERSRFGTSGPIVHYPPFVDQPPRVLTFTALRHLSRLWHDGAYHTSKPWPPVPGIFDIIKVIAIASCGSFC